MSAMWTIEWLSLWLIGGSVLAQQAGPANGLKGDYFNGPNFEQKAFTRTDPQIAFDWNGRMPAPGVQREYFSVRWTGKLYAPTSGNYQFSATADDGVRVWVGGRNVIDEWRKQDDSQFVGEVTLKAGQSYDLKVEYYNDWKGSIIYLFWKPPTDSRFAATTMYQIIPAHYLTSSPIRPANVSLTVAKPSAKPVLQSVAPVATKPPDRVASQPVLARRRPVVVSRPSSQLEAAAPKPAGNFTQLTVGQTLLLRNVFFGQSEYRLLSASYAELDELTRALEVNPGFRVEVAGHTDNVGDPRLNLALSENRAKVVAHYLTRHGIAGTRIETNGYGGTHPVADNATEEGRAKNRRVEITIR